MIYVDGLSIDVTHFPDGTSQVWKLPSFILERKLVSVKWKFLTEAEFLHLAQLKELLDNSGVSATLELSFLPYGRQDKPVNNHSTFALHTFAKLLSSLNFVSITCMDPHSKFCELLVKNFKAIYPVQQVSDVIKLTDSQLVCYPDAGAHYKYSQVYDYPFIYGEKVRDQLSGHITSYKLEGDPSGKNVLIVDDICDGGMTFILLAKDLLAAGAKEVNLFVTHGIFSKGIRVLKDAGIKRIFTQDGEAVKYQDQIMFRRLA